MLTSSDSAIVLPWVSLIKLEKKTLKGLTLGFRRWSDLDQCHASKAGIQLDLSLFGNSELSSQKWPFHNNLSGREQLTGQLTR